MRKVVMVEGLVSKVHQEMKRLTEANNNINNNQSRFKIGLQIYSLDTDIQK